MIANFIRAGLLSVALALPAIMLPGELLAAGRIVAVVEDQVISTGDLEDRVSLALASSGLSNTQENRDRLRPQVLRLYIDETLQRLEAQRLGLRATVEEVQRTLGNIAQRNNMTMDQLDEFLRRQGSDLLTLKRQIETQILWAKVVNRQLRPRVRVGPDQVDLAIKDAERARNEPQWLIAEITLPVVVPAQEDEVRADAEELAQTLRNGAAFPALAREFSGSASAQYGGDLGWVQPSSLSEDTRSVIEGMSVGEIKGPVRTNAGWQLFMLRARRAPGENAQVEAPPAPPPPAPAQPAKPPSRVRLAQLVIPVPENATEADTEKLIQQASGYQRRLGSCDALRREAAKEDSGFDGDLGWLEVADLPEVLRQLVTNLPNNRLSPPLTGPAGIQLIMVCERVGGAPARAAEPARPVERTPPPPPLPSMERAAVQERLESQQLDRLAERYLRDLRRDAYVDLRA
ncbi:MAG TPA: peptidylprolyl isomerase [Geminicoccus sp.]|jgi:peptidyl-prolyl cis-trans isomerase SurA|uniref:peptidylprolyl isomerase n=1 Tax=Geminicoccus sp. TaxID=2024832 RepID=UPI002E33EF76|nr:peptidylprolyl isomerase [Geminicoccus sp.]HEX2527483.1 peptidylprolyl isomerase [Geminicoccus sp.]